MKFAMARGMVVVQYADGGASKGTHAEGDNVSGGGGGEKTTRTTT